MQNTINFPHVPYNSSKRKAKKGQSERRAQSTKSLIVIILTATSTKSFGRLILRIEPEKDLPSKDSAAEASSGVKNSKRA